ncbi:MAG: RHS repeat-associated core domain-containing protein, partial [Armatimonadota bacterium]
NQRSYDVWGGVRSGATSGFPNTRYVANLGHKQDDESDLIYMRARYYEPWTGRFISEDPARDGGNWFVYATNNPVGNVDTDGRVVGPAYAALILAVLGAASTVAGYLAGFYATIEHLQEIHPAFRPSVDWLDAFLPAPIGVLQGVLAAPRMNVGGGIRIENLIRKYGIRTAGIGFFVGLVYGHRAALVAFEIYYSDYFDDF